MIGVGKGTPINLLDLDSVFYRAWTSAREEPTQAQGEVFDLTFPFLVAMQDRRQYSNYNNFFQNET